MKYISWTMAIFALIGAFDRIIGNKIGLGKEFEKGLQLLGAMMLSMVGMIVLSPLFAKLMQPLLNHLTGLLDPSTFPAILFANDMGGAPLSVAVANDELMGKFNGLVVSSMMGATISFTVPYALGVVDKDKRQDMLLGLLCGITTIPLGCFIGGLILRVPILALLVNLLPLILLAVLIIIGLLKIPQICTKIFSIIGYGIQAVVTVGLAVGIFEMLTGVKLIPHTAELSEGTDIIINAACVLAGAFPLVNLISMLLKKPLHALSNKMGVDNTSTLGLLATLVSNTPTFGMLNKMEEKGRILNSAFAVSGAFVFGGHLAFTMAFSADCLWAVIIGKLIAGFSALAIAIFVIRRKSAIKTEI